MKPRHAFMIAILLMCGCSSDSRRVSEQEKTSEKIRDLLSRLDDDPDLLHSDYTPAVHELVKIGKPAIEPTLPYLLSDNQLTRMHAQRVVEGVILTSYGFKAGQGWPDPDKEQEFREFDLTLWDSDKMGGKDVNEATSDERKAYIERVKKWLGTAR